MKRSLVLSIPKEPKASRNVENSVDIDDTVLVAGRWTPKGGTYMDDMKKKPAADAENWHMDADDDLFFAKERELIDQMKSKRDLRVIRGGKTDEPVTRPNLRAGGIIKKAA